jgi:hypothetical protein
MSVHPSQYPGELQRLANLIAELRGDVDALRSRAFRIPILDADPPSTEPGNLWAFTDGRIRLRTAVGMQNFIPGAVGSSTSGTAKPAPGALQTYTSTWGALWTQTYKGDGTKRSASSMFYGNNADGLGRQKVQIGFDYAAIAAALAGSTVNRVELYFTQGDCYSSAGCDVHYGAHANVSAPGTWGGIYRGDVSTVHYGGSNGREWFSYEAKWADVSSSFGTWLRDGLAKGISINQPTDSRSYYGYGTGSPQLRITYVK